MIAVRYCSVFSLLSLLTPRPGKTPDTHYFSLLTQTYSLVRVRGRFALLRLFKGVRYTVYTKRPMSYNSHTSNKESLKNVPFFSLSVLTIPLRPPVCPRPCYGFYPAKRRINNLISSSCYTDSMPLAFS